MAKLTKDIFVVPEGKIYPQTFCAGEEITPQIEASAKSLGAYPVNDETANMTKAEIVSEIEAHGVDPDARRSKDFLAQKLRGLRSKAMTAPENK